MKNNLQSVYDEDEVYENFVKIQKPAIFSGTKDKRNMLRSSSSLNMIGERPVNEYTYKKGLLPKNSGLDKDKLYLENIGLKQQVHSLESQKTKFKTKINKLEHGISEKKIITSEQNCNFAPGKKYLNLANSLKETVKAASENLKSKEIEIESLKKKRKNCQISELESELKSYMDECVRLKNIINLMSFEKNEAHEIKLKEQSEKLKILQKEKVEMMKELDDLREENSAQKETICVLKKRKEGKKNENLVKELGSTVQDLQEKLNACVMEFVEKEELYKKEIGYMRRNIEDKEKMIESQNELLEEFERFQRSDELEVVFQGNVEILPVKVIKSMENYGKNKLPKTISSNGLAKDRDILEIILHVKMTMQVKNLKKPFLPNFLFGKHYQEDLFLDETQLFAVFYKAIFSSIKDETIEKKVQKFCNYLISISNFSCKLKKSKIKSLRNAFLKILPKWTTFTIDEEITLIKSLQFKFTEIIPKFNSICAEFDKSEKFLISFDEFLSVLRELDLEVTDREFEYIKIKSYASSNLISRLMYRNLLSLFENKLFFPKVISKCIKDISRCLSNDNVTFEAVFLVEAGFITKESFEVGLERLKLKGKYQKKTVEIIEFIGPKICLESTKLKKAIYNYYFEELNHISKLLYSQRSLPQKNGFLNEASKVSTLAQVEIRKKLLDSMELISNEKKENTTEEIFEKNELSQVINFSMTDKIEKKSDIASDNPKENQETIERFNNFENDELGFEVYENSQSEDKNVLKSSNHSLQESSHTVSIQSHSHRFSNSQSKSEIITTQNEEDKNFEKSEKFSIKEDSSFFREIKDSIYFSPKDKESPKKTLTTPILNTRSLQKNLKSSSLKSLPFPNSSISKNNTIGLIEQNSEKSSSEISDSSIIISEDIFSTRLLDHKQPSPQSSTHSHAIYKKPSIKSIKIQKTQKILNKTLEVPFQNPLNQIFESLKNDLSTDMILGKSGKVKVFKLSQPVGRSDSK